jgi:hypothetical protein
LFALVLVSAVAHAASDAGAGRTLVVVVVVVVDPDGQYGAMRDVVPPSADMPPRGQFP